MEIAEIVDQVMANKDAAIERLVHENAKLRTALVEAQAERLYNALHCGVIGDGGKWWPGGRSDAEWFCRWAGIEYEPIYDKDTLMQRVPEIARTMVKKMEASR